MKQLVRLCRIVCSVFKWIRKQICTFYVRLSCAESGKGLCVNGYSRVTKTTYLGKHVNFNGMTIQGKARVTIGDYFHSGPGCLMITSNHNYEGATIPYDDTTIDKPIIIQDFVWLGTRVIVLGGACIGEGAILQAGSVVVGNIPPYSIAGGAPAKVFSHRDAVHFEKLKQEGKFH